MIARSGGWLMVVLMAFAVAACAGAGKPPLNPDGPAAEAATAPYRLGLTDRVRITTYDEPDLTGEFQVGGTGTISFPLLGEVPAEGKTAAELQDLLTRRLAEGYLKDPHVAVEVTSFRPFFIMGEVERPGRYPTTEGMTVQRAIALAGGYTYRANKGKVFIRRRGDSVEREVSADADVAVAPGDVLRIGERYF
ncbi:polysaccharide biosynthesis/export family protein [Stakelama saccharophila]|uniref:Polysaccharide biosynthesis/export family protein n=1 Tax=Stakelama saccharophila TaxID=3075605 RepID=A0ABZ0BAZ2_9SPHN|nr:polysaccharide biosynthesis/export family protein [Stakelama sp. W311]WNO54523.1 polysaccharide biosynthesis/export family protein [Stakelama sp. W311]